MFIFVPAPVVDPAAFSEALFVPEDAPQCIFDPNVKDRCRWLTTVPVQESQVLIQNEVGFGHQLVRLSDETFLCSVSVAELFVLVVCDEKLAHIAQGLCRVIFTVDHQNLEAFPSEGLEVGKVVVHVFLEVQFADHGIDLEFDPVFLAPVCDPVEYLDLITRSSSDVNVRPFVERVAGYSDDVDVSAMPSQEGFLYEAAICDYRNGLQSQLLLAEINHLAQEFGVDEGLSSSKVDFAHTGPFEQSQSLLRPIGMFSVGGCRGVEAKPAALVALPSEMVIHRDRAFSLAAQKPPKACDDQGG